MTSSPAPPAAPRPLWVAKLGGRILDDPDTLDRFLARLAASGQRALLVHGGGAQMHQLADRLGIRQRMVDGRRVTDDQTLELALMTFAGSLNKRLVARMHRHGLRAIGLTGADADVIRATRRPPIDTSEGTVDFGWVGDTTPDRVDAAFLHALLERSLTPVLCALTHDGQGHLLNTNADTLASVVAAALATSALATSTLAATTPAAPSHPAPVRLLLLSDVPGVLRDPSDPASLIERLDRSAAEALIADGTITAGMIPKIRMSLEAVSRGVHDVVIARPDAIDAIFEGRAGGGTHVE